MSKRGSLAYEVIGQAVRPLVETLEQRQLLSAAVEQGVWNIQVDGALASSDNRVVIATRANNPSILQCGVNGSIYARTRADRIKGLRLTLGAGDDQVTLKLGKHARRLRADVLAGAGDDIIVAGAEVNRLYGQGGNDQIIGGGGRGDRLRGGVGSNRVMNSKGQALSPAEWVVYLGSRGDWPGDHGQPGTPNEPTEPSLPTPLDPVQNIQGTDSLVKVGSEAQLKAWLIDEAVRQYQQLLGTQTGKRWSEYVDGAGPYYRLGNGYEPEDGTFYASPLESPATWQINVSDQGVSIRRWWWNGEQRMGSDRTIPAYAALLEPQAEEPGVQTPSVLKTDGRYLYVFTQPVETLGLAAGYAGTVSIVDPSAPDGSQLLANIPVPDRLVEMFVSNGRLILISQGQELAQAPAGWQYDPWSSDAYLPCTRVGTYNISDPASPMLVETTTIDGYHGTGRMVDGRLYLLTGLPELPRPLQTAAGDVEVFGEEVQQRYTAEQWQAIQALPLEQQRDPSTWPSPVDVTVQHHRQSWRYETVEEYRARLEAMPLAELLPGYTTAVPNGEGSTITATGPIVRLPEAYIPADGVTDKDHRLGLSLLLLNPADGSPGVDSSATVYGTRNDFHYDGLVHASVDSLYYTETRYAAGTTVDPRKAGYRVSPAFNELLPQARTAIHKFSLGASEVSLAAVGAVPGMVMNAPSIDVEGDQFRLCTEAAGEGSEHQRSLLILQQNGSDLKVVGGLTDLPPTIVYFQGDRAYYSDHYARHSWPTVLDLSNASNPVVVSQVTMSRQFWFVGPNRMLTLEALNEHGMPFESPGRPANYRVVLYDVSDASRPRVLDSFTLGTTAVFTPEYFADQKALVINVREPISGSSEYVEHVWKGLVVRIDDEDTLHATGAMPLADFAGAAIWSDTPYRYEALITVGEYLCSLRGLRMNIAKVGSADDLVGTAVLPGQFIITIRTGILG